MISQPTLPETLIARCLDVLLKLSADQRDFMRIIVEIVQDLRDEEASDEEASEGEDGDGEEDEEVRQRRAANKKQAEPTEEEAVQQAVIDARRLIIVREMLERVVGALQENTALHGLIPQLIAPAVRSKDALVREQGLICLGLCCLLDKVRPHFQPRSDGSVRGIDHAILCGTWCSLGLLVEFGAGYVATFH